MKQIITTIMLSVILFSCVKERELPPQPSIEFVRYTAFGRDSADCVISFKDGDGDIGILQGDTVSADDFRLVYFYKDLSTGQFKPFDVNPTNTTFDTLTYSYRVPYLTPDGQYKSLEGEILAKLRAAPIYYPTHKIVKFEITLRDRGGNVSNKVITNEITLP